MIDKTSLKMMKAWREHLAKVAQETDDLINSGPVAELFVSRCDECFLEKVNNYGEGTCCHPNRPLEEGADATPEDGSMAKWCPLLEKPLLLKAEREL